MYVKRIKYMYKFLENFVWANIWTNEPHFTINGYFTEAAPLTRMREKTGPFNNWSCWGCVRGPS